MYTVFKKLDLVEITKEYSECVKTDSNKDSNGIKDVVVCYDGPPSVSGSPGIHHVFSRTLKDVFCRYRYSRGEKIINKAGWDTHGLPVELCVEKQLGITKKDIGSKISIEEYNRKCKRVVEDNISKWERLTFQHGYCADVEEPYITCRKEYMESEWWAFKELYKKGYVYQDYSIQPYSPAAGTGLSSHELNQPGCYRDVKDITITVMFKDVTDEDTYFLAWTTTPWTLPANSALAVNKEIEYVEVICKNKYSGKEINVILAAEALGRYFENKEEYKRVRTFLGKDLIGRKYEQLYQFIQPESAKKKHFSIFNFFLSHHSEKGGRSFEIIPADYVTATDGTGIVHIAPSFGVDDRRVAKENNIEEITVLNSDGRRMPIVDEEGKFVAEIEPWAGVYVRKEYYNSPEESIDVNIEIIKDLKKRGLCFKSEKHIHSYPHCWRTDKPLIYYPLRTWFIKTSAVKDELIKLNENINWNPKSTGEGRFRNWLENIVDWNVSRNRFWGTPLPIWVTDDGREMKVIGSFEELEKEIQIANEQFHLNQPTTIDDIHKPYIDTIILSSSNGCRMHRVPEVMDVWFDSGCMPFAQYHYPFVSTQEFEDTFPAEFICEGVDQTRGWFYTMHVLAVMLFDNIAYRNVVANGLVLDKNGDKMSKRLGNTIDPFEMFDKYGADAVRWYLLLNTDFWESVKFDENGVAEVVRKFFMTFFNTYNFYALYYNSNEDIKEYHLATGYSNNLQNIDKWILSRLNNVIKNVALFLDKYSPKEAIREVNDFVIEDLSNWYVRLNRKRFSKNDDDTDRGIAFGVLHECIQATTKLIYPFAPFFSSWMNDNINPSQKEKIFSPKCKEEYINTPIEEEMILVRNLISTVLFLRREAEKKVRQPLSKILISSQNIFDIIIKYKDIIIQEVNVKDVILQENLSEYTSKTVFKDDIYVALDTHLTETLISEGIARDFIREVQKKRKEMGCNVTDTIDIEIYSDDSSFIQSINLFKKEICAELICRKFVFVKKEETKEKFTQNGKCFFSVNIIK